MRTIVLVFILAGWFGAASAEDIHLRISPNPAVSKIELSIGNVASGALKIEIYSVLGTLLQTTDYGASAANIIVEMNVSNFPDGVYLVRISQNGNTTVKRLKVQHSE